MFCENIWISVLEKEKYLQFLFIYLFMYVCIYLFILQD